MGDLAPGAAAGLPLASDSETFLFLGALFVLGLWLVYAGFSSFRTGKIVENTPTEKARSVALGRTELEGTAVPVEEPLDAPFTAEPAVLADYEIEEYRSSPADDDEDWETIESGTLRVPFYVEDETGRVRVEPDGADLVVSDDNETTQTVGGSASPPDEVAEFLSEGAPSASIQRTGSGGLLGALGRSAPWSVGSTAGSGGTAGSTSPYTNNRRRYTQEILPAGADAYVFGAAEELDATGSNAERVRLVADPMTEEFIVSDRGEDSLASAYRRKALLYLSGGIVLSTGALYLLVQAW